MEKGYFDLIEYYTEKHRYYHTLAHIESCLNHFDCIKAAVSDLFCLEVALWFHDVIYNPQSHNNEYLSAEMAQKFLASININMVQIEKIKKLILITQHPSKPITMDEKYLVDIDLSILGANPDVFKSYDDAIRKEYSHIPDDLYKIARKKVLNGFLNQKIYQTDYFYDKLEQKAIHNIKKVTNALK